VNPQWLKQRGAQSSADTTTTTTITLPIIRAREGVTPTIIEVLRVYFIFENSGEVDSSVYVYLTTKNFGTTAVTNPSEPSLIAMAGSIIKITTSGQFSESTNQQMDLTDGAGHGVLVATDNLYMQIVSSSTTVTQTESPTATPPISMCDESEKFLINENN